MFLSLHFWASLFGLRHHRYSRHSANALDGTGRFFRASFFLRCTHSLPHPCRHLRIKILHSHLSFLVYSNLCSPFPFVQCCRSTSPTKSILSTTFKGFPKGEQRK